MAGLYDENGYLNISKVLNTASPFILVCGGRGTGKTYGALKTAVEQKRKFLLLRRTQTQADIITQPEFSPFKKICADMGWSISTFPITKYNSAISEAIENDNGKLIPAGEPLGYTAALSTFSNVRGFDASDVDLIIYDEFIPERHERPIKNEFDALMNCYETVNRNRELQGDKPAQLLALANANDLANPIFTGLTLVKRAMKMLETGQELFHDSSRGIDLYILQKSPISEQKQETALYRLNRNSDFTRMSLSNQFSYDAPSNIKSMPLKEFTPVVAIGEICVYRHKSGNYYYISMHVQGSPATYGTGEADIARFRQQYGWLYRAYLANCIIFEEYTCEILLTRFLK